MNTERMDGNKHRYSVRIRLPSEDDTVKLGQELAMSLPAGTVVALEGTLGAGKTCLVRAVAEALGVAVRDITSPTFTLWQTYQGTKTIHHLDAYRVRDEDEFFELGVEECFATDAITFIEWADRVEGCLPVERLAIHIDVTAENQREVEITTASPRLSHVVAAISNANKNQNSP